MRAEVTVDESTAAAEAVEARDPGVFRLNVASVDVTIHTQT